jgi:hypothetical protein
MKEGTLNISSPNSQEKVKYRYIPGGLEQVCVAVEIKLVRDEDGRMRKAQVTTVKTSKVEWLEE